MSLSVSDMTRIKRLVGSRTYASNGIIQGKDLTSTQLACNTRCSAKRTDMKFVGKLKTVREASKMVDFTASQVADYVLVSEFPQTTTGPGFGRQLTRNVLCAPISTSCISVLETKVGPLKPALLNRNRL